MNLNFIITFLLVLLSRTIIGGRKKQITKPPASQFIQTDPEARDSQAVQTNLEARASQNVQTKNLSFYKKRNSASAISLANFSTSQLEFLTSNYSDPKALFDALEKEYEDRKANATAEQVKHLLKQEILLRDSLLPLLDPVSKARFNSMNKMSYKEANARNFKEKHASMKQNLLDEGYTEANARLVCENPAWKKYMDIGAKGLEKNKDFFHQIDVAMDVRKEEMLDVVSKVSAEELNYLHDANPDSRVCVNQWVEGSGNIQWNVWEEDQPIGKRFFWSIFRRYNPRNGSNHLTLKEIHACYNVGIRPQLARQLKQLETPGLELYEFLENSRWNVRRIEEIVQEGIVRNLYDLRDAL